LFCILPIRGISEIRGLPQLADRAEVALLPAGTANNSATDTDTL